MNSTRSAFAPHTMVPVPPSRVPGPLSSLPVCRVPVVTTTVSVRLSRACTLLCRVRDTTTVSVRLSRARACFDSSGLGGRGRGRGRIRFTIFPVCLRNLARAIARVHDRRCRHSPAGGLHARASAAAACERACARAPLSPLAQLLVRAELAPPRHQGGIELYLPGAVPPRGRAGTQERREGGAAPCIP